MNLYTDLLTILFQKYCNKIYIHRPKKNGLYASISQEGNIQL